MSSPPHQALSFEAMLDAHPSPHHILSSPVQSAFPHYEPTSPFNTTSLRTKTPNNDALRRRMRTHDGFLVSPLVQNPHTHSGQYPTLNVQLQQTPISSFLVRGGEQTPVRIADPNAPPDWANMDLGNLTAEGMGMNIGMDGLEGLGMGMNGFEQGLEVYASPIKMSQQHSSTSIMSHHSSLHQQASQQQQHLAAPYSAATTPLPDAPGDVTPAPSPLIRSAPGSTKKPRSVTGLGTPTGVHRSAKRIRQATYDANSMPVSPTGPSRRRTADASSSSSLTTRAPLARAVSTSSASFLHAPAFSQDNRVVSSSSVMTASTSFDQQLMSPSLGATYAPMPQGEYTMMPPSTSLPELVGSQHPSPNMSNLGRSPLCTPQQPSTVFYTSPEAEQGVFLHQQQQPPLMGQVASIMSMPNSASMASVASFPSQYRHGTLSTIVETPQLGGEDASTLQYHPMQSAPTQPDLSSSAAFQPIPYPPVPGMSLHHAHPHDPASAFPSTTTQPLDIHAWSSHTAQAQQQQYGGFAPPPPQPIYGFTSQPPPPMRHASGSNLHTSAAHTSSFPMVNRSVSAPYISHHHLPSSLSHGGLFGPLPTSQSDPSSSLMSTAPLELPSMPYASSSGANRVVSSPDTPRKRQNFPPVGKRLRPGPKPKAKTPKKGKGAASSPEPGSGIDPSSVFGGPSSSQAGEDRPPREPSPKPVLVFGPDLSTISVSHMQRTDSGTLLPPPLTSQPSASSSTGSASQPQSSNQPQLVIQPPRQAFTADGLPAAGLPRTFLEKLYTTFLTLEGSMTGQPVKRFKCLIEGCERHFPRKSAIHSHIQTHLEDKPFICTADDCHAAFVRQHDLRRHTRIHSGTKPFPCPCGKGFARGDALMRHRQRGICSGSLVPRRDDM